MDALPSWIDREAWEGFVEMRKAKGKRTPFTTRAATMILKTLQKLKDAGHDPNAALDQSTTNGWSDVYEPKEKEIRRAATTTTANDWIKAQDEHAAKATPMPENLKRLIRRVS